MAADADHSPPSRLDIGPSESLGLALLIGTSASLVSVRLLPFVLLVLILVWLFQDRPRLSGIFSFERWDPVLFSFGGVIALALLSTIWSEVLWVGIPKVLLAGAVALGALYLFRQITVCSDARAEAAERGLIAGFCLGIGFLVIEVLSGQALQIAVYNMLKLPVDMMQPVRHFHWEGGELVAIADAHINRNFAVATLLAWPVVMSTLGRFGPKTGGVFSTLMLVATATAVFNSRHESSKVAFIIGCVVFGLALVSSTWLRRALMAGWVIACLGAVPAAIMAHRADLHNSALLQNSMQHRIVIWNHTAEKALERPLLGIGAYMTYVLGPRLNEGTATQPDEKQRRTLSRHAHNVFLQTWFELGAAGALLLATCGLAVLSSIGRLKGTVQPFALATFATSAVMMSASYGIWQAWYLALFGYTAVALAVGVRNYGGVASET